MRLEPAGNEARVARLWSVPAPVRCREGLVVLEGAAIVADDEDVGGHKVFPLSAL